MERGVQTLAEPLVIAELGDLVERGRVLRQVLELVLGVVLRKCRSSAGE